MKNRRKMPSIILQIATASIHLDDDEKMRWKMEEESKIYARKCCFQCVRYLSLKTVKTIKIKLPPVIVWASIARWISIDHIQCVIHFYLIFSLRLYSRFHSNVRRIHDGIDFFRNSIWTRWWSWKWIFVFVFRYALCTRDLRANCTLSINYRTGICEIQCAWLLENEKYIITLQKSQIWNIKWVSAFDVLSYTIHYIFEQNFYDAIFTVTNISFTCRRIFFRCVLCSQIFVCRPLSIFVIFKRLFIMEISLWSKSNETQFLWMKSRA